MSLKVILAMVTIILFVGVLIVQQVVESYRKKLIAKLEQNIILLERENFILRYAHEKMDAMPDNAMPKARKISNDALEETRKLRDR